MNKHKKKILEISSIDFRAERAYGEYGLHGGPNMCIRLILKRSQEEISNDYGFRNTEYSHHEMLDGDLVVRYKYIGNHKRAGSVGGNYYYYHQFIYE